MRTLLLAAVLLSQAFAQDNWIYIVPPDGEEHRRPPLTALALGTDLPEGIELDVEFQGEFQRFGQLRYGDEDSLRVTVALDHHGRSQADLYVDAGRDQRIDRDDMVSGTGNAWELSVPVAGKVDGAPTLTPRRVAFQLGKTGAIFSYATLGFFEGEASLGDQSVTVRRQDGDGNGFFTDHRDAIWLDLDDNLGFEALRELFLYAPTLRIGGQRWALRSDRLGESLSIERLEGVGGISIALPDLPGGLERSVTGLEVLLVGRDGSAVGVRSLGAPVEVPVGDYRVGMMTLRASLAGGATTSFVFSEPGARSDLTWYTVDKDAQVTIDALGELAFSMSMAEPECAPGADLSIRPRLLTGDGLVINTAYQGTVAPSFSAGTLFASIELQDPAGKVLARANSGFN